MGREIKFSPATFYLGNVDMLARSVEGQTDGEEPIDGKPGDQERLQIEENLTKDTSDTTRT
jgi:triacylglycerol lipase